MVDQILLNDTLQKINASLNKRFEKNANLYISKQDEYEIKKNLCNEAYGGVVDMAKAKGISNDIIVKVIMRNAGVLDVKDIRKFKKELRPILENANYKALSYMMEDVLGNNVYMQKKLRHMLFFYYMKSITSMARLNYWKQDIRKFDEEERATLFKLIIDETKHKDASMTLEFKIGFILEAFNNYPSVLKRNVFVKLKEILDEGEKKEFFKFLCKEMEAPSIEKRAVEDTYNFALIDAYASYGEQAFNEAVGQIKATSPRKFKQYIRVIRKLFCTEKDKDSLARMFDTICKVYESPYIKNHIKREIDKKVWETTKLNEILYEERKAKIDGLMSLIKQTDKRKYLSFADISMDVLKGVPPTEIAYYWINMKSPEFEQSILDSFSQLSSEYSQTMEKTYSWLFEHSMKKGENRELTRLCERLAQSLQKFRSLGKASDFYNILDSMWVDNVVEHKLKGITIKDYMFENHFDRVKAWE